MKTIVDFLKENKYTDGEIYKVGDVSFTTCEDSIVLICNGDKWAIPQSYKYGINDKIQSLLYNDYDIEMRYCDECGKPYDAGFMGGDGEWYCCEDCFEPMMDRNFGKGKWRPTEKEGRYGGYYEYLTDSGKWEDTGAFYTEWN